MEEIYPIGGGFGYYKGQPFRPPSQAEFGYGRGGTVRFFRARLIIAHGEGKANMPIEIKVKLCGKEAKDLVNGKGMPASEKSERDATGYMESKAKGGMPKAGPAGKWRKT